ncbi:MAG: hypothetical protein M1379_09630 [Firmicutes bacterium]|nr:hypothetical protein [Bacillota bacterium]
MQITISEQAAEYIRKKGGHVVIYRGSLSGCCGGNVAHPAMELGKPRRGPENYQPLNVAGVNVHLDKEVASFSGTAEISLDKALWWNTLSLDYREE